MSELKMSDEFNLPLKVFDVYSEKEVRDKYNDLVFATTVDAYKLRCMVVATNEHDKLKEENTKLRELLKDCRDCLSEANMYVGFDFGDSIKLVDQLLGDNNE